MSEEFYNRLTLSDEGNITVLNNNVDNRSRRHGCQYSVEANAPETTAANSRPYRNDNRVERTEVNLHLKHRTQRRSTASESASSRGRHRANDQNRPLIHTDGDLRTYCTNSGSNFEGEERRTPVFLNDNECDTGTVLDRGYMPEIPRATPASNEQAVVVGAENAKALVERMNSYGGSEWNGANLAPTLASCSYEGGLYASYTQPSSKQAQLCPHVKGQQQESLREDNNNVSCVSFTDRDDKRYNSSSVKHHLASRYSDRYIFHPGELERQYRTDGPPSNYYYGIQTENMMRWKNSSREKNSRPMPGTYGKNEKHSLSKSLPRNSRYSSDRNVNSSDSESGPSSSDREYWPNSYCLEKRKKRVRKKGNYRAKHYLGESDPSEHSDPGHRRYNEEFPGHTCCSSADCDYEQQRSRSSVYGLNNRRNISRSLTSVSSLDDEAGAFRTGFTFNRISPRGRGNARISKINIKSFSTVQLNQSRVTRATSSTSDIGSHDGAHSRLYALEKNGVKTTPRKTTKDSPSISVNEFSDSSCASPSFKKSPFNSLIRGRKSSTSGGETPSTTPVPRICSPEIVDDKFQAPASSSFKTIHSPGSQGSGVFLTGEAKLNTTSTEEGAKALKNLIENLEKDVESEDPVGIKRPELLPLKTSTATNTDSNLNDDIRDITSPESTVASPTVSNNLLLSNENDLPLSPGGMNRVPSFSFGKDTPYSIQKPFVTLVNIQEEDEAACSDGSSGRLNKRRESVTQRKMSKENKGDTKETDAVVASPLRRPSYVKAQIANQLSPKPDEENIVEVSRTKPNGKEEHVGCDNDSYQDETSKQIKETMVNDDNGNSKKRMKKKERPRIPTILNLDKVLDELFDDVKKQQSIGNEEARIKVSRQESAPQLTGIPTASEANREQRKRSNSIDDPSTAVKLIASEADSTYMQRADGKVERRHEKSEQNDIDKSLELLDELVVELSEKPGSQERPALSRNVDGKSAGSASDVVMSPSPSQTSINSEKSTSGSEPIDKDVGVSSLPEMYPSRYHSDPTPRVKEDYTTIQETIAEYDIKARNSNSEPAINGKLLEQAADLAKAKAAEREENAEHKNNIEHATSSPADLSGNAQPQQKLRRRESEKARRRRDAAKAAAQIEAKDTKLNDGDADGDSGGKSGNVEQPITDHHTWPRTKTEPETGEAPTGKKKKATKSEMRWHVVQNLIETEQSYVQSLQYLVKEYLNPLRKSEGIVEPALVNEMFYQIPEILKYHEGFLKQLAVRVQDWSDNSKLGDIFVSSFTKCLLVDAYSQFINNFLRARTAARSATMAKPGFLKYCEQRSRDHKEKLTLQDLMIMPVQRIPRYVLIITDLLKYTPAEHPDHGNLLSALGEIKTLAERMNKGEQEIDQAEKEAERLRDLEASIEGISGLVLPRRKYKRQDLVAEMKGGLSKKDRCLFLFSDLLVCATVKRKQTSLRRGSLSLFSGQSAAEMNKYRLLWQSPLDDVELVTTDGDLKSPVKSPDQTYREKLEQDLNTVSTISKLTESVSVPHQALDDAIRELASDLNRLLVDQHPQRSSNASFMSYENTVVLNIGSRESIENYMFIFLSKEIKSSWEAYFLDAKQQLAYTKDSSPNFQNAIPINKSRSGLQFTCASPTVAARLTKRGTHCGSGDVWVASSDGCVGQVSMLSPLREFEQGTTYSPCQARILSISPVPGWKLAGINTTNVEYEFKDPVENTKSNTLRSKSSGYHSDENLPNNRRSVTSTTKAGREEIIAFDSSTDDEDMGDDSFTASPSPPSFDGRLSPEGSSLGTAGSLDGDISSDCRDDSDYQENQSTDDESKARRRSEKKRLEGHCGDMDEANQQPTVWMGAEDGYIYIFPVTSALKQRRNKTKIQKGSPVQCILYLENQVFVGLANGDLCVYKRSPNYAWEINAPKNITISSNARITCMTAVLGRLWVGCNNQVVLVNTTTLEIETRFNASVDSSRSLHAMASSGMGVWISIQSLSVIRLYHASTCEHLADVDTKDAVHKMLASSDAIIKQHKAACLRVTALLTCKDLLWIGTSAGVVLTLPLPIIAPNATSVQAPLDVTASPQGHTGHVRFLTAVEMGKPEEKDETTNSQPTNRSPRRSQLNIEKANLPFPSENVFVISGGDGYEDFKSTANESAGREDSTNHLLIWKV